MSKPDTISPENKGSRDAPCSPLVAALAAGSKHCAELIRRRPAAPAQPTWTLVRDVLNDMRDAAEKAENAKLSHEEGVKDL